jgi:hypothetical protein
MHLMAFANDNSIGYLESRTLLLCAPCLDVKGICRPRARFDRVEQGGNDGAESSDAYCRFQWKLILWQSEARFPVGKGNQN